MGRVGLVRTLKGVIIFLALIVTFCYCIIFPESIRFTDWPLNMTWMVKPFTWAVTVSVIPIAIALVLFWNICTEIGRDNSFCHKNARRLTGIGFCALVDTGYCAVGTVTIEILAGSPIWLMGLMVCTVGLAIALAAFLLSHLILKAADLKSDSDLTI